MLPEYQVEREVGADDALVAAERRRTAERAANRVAELAKKFILERRKNRHEGGVCFQEVLLLERALTGQESNEKAICFELG